MKLTLQIHHQSLRIRFLKVILLYINVTIVLRLGYSLCIMLPLGVVQTYFITGGGSQTSGQQPTTAPGGQPINPSGTPGQQPGGGRFNDTL